jgi:hypothetical protein
MRYLFILMMVVCFLGCVPYADSPLTDAGVQPIDAKLLGSWYWKDESDSGYIHIGLDKTSKILRIMLVEFGKEGELTASEFTGHSSQLQGNSYLNLERVRPEDQEPGFLFVKYTLKPNALGISLMDAGVVSKDIESGVLKGQVTKGEWTSNIHITASQEALQAYILKQDKALFSETSDLPRLNLP